MIELKRYSNRRLYDASSSKTVTLEDVARIIQSGEEVRVIDNTSGEDITQSILGQTFLKISLGQKNTEFSQFMLTALIREAGNNNSGLFSRLIMGGFGAATLTRDKLESILHKMVKLGELEVKEVNQFKSQILETLSHDVKEKHLKLKKELGKIMGKIDKDEKKSLEELSLKLDEVSEMIRDIRRKPS